MINTSILWWTLLGAVQPSDTSRACFNKSREERSSTNIKCLFKKYCCDDPKILHWPLVFGAFRKQLQKKEFEKSKPLYSR